MFFEDCIMPASIPKGIVFVSYAREDRERVARLVDQLKTRFNVFWDVDVPIGSPWRAVLSNVINRAGCVLGLWTEHLNDASFVTSEVENAFQRGVLVPVKLDPKAKIPFGFDRLQYLDLSAWSGESAQGLERLFEQIGLFLEHPIPSQLLNALPESASWVMPGSLRAVGELRSLVKTVSTLGGVLVQEGGPVGDVTATLNEIHATYAGAGEAVDRFLEPANDAKGLLKSYLALAGGGLSRIVDGKRGHCSRILELYMRAGGLRDWLSQRAKSELLRAADDAFSGLATADEDMFAKLSRIAGVLSDEATVIANLLLGGQDQLAAQRIMTAQQTLLPLRRELASAMSQLQAVEASLGFVPESPAAQT
jgi:hypothetical protein